MSEKLVKRFVKGPKSLWLNDDEGGVVEAKPGEEVMLTEERAASKAAFLLTPNEMAAEKKEVKKVADAAEKSRAENAKEHEAYRKEAAKPTKPTKPEK